VKKTLRPSSSILKNNQNSQNDKLLPQKLIQKAKDIATLSKLIISASVTFTTYTGYIVAGHQVDLRLLLILTGVFLLSAGACTLNQILEKGTDALMPRTMNRPLPAGRVLIPEAKLWAAGFLMVGTLLLWLYANAECVILGLINVAWYNWVYTPLKKRSVWALFAGTVTGVIPFFMGTVAVAGEFPRTDHLFIAFYLFLWQIPHFLLLVSKYGKEYELAGLASYSKISNEHQIIKLAYLWMIACCVTSLFLPYFGITANTYSTLALLITTSLVILMVAFGMLSGKNQSYKTPFITTNLMQLSLMLTLVFDSLIN
jgi:protoheme IX farnesyltransferase